MMEAHWNSIRMYRSLQIRLSDFEPSHSYRMLFHELILERHFWRDPELFIEGLRHLRHLHMYWPIRSPKTKNASTSVYNCAFISCIPRCCRYLRKTTIIKGVNVTLFIVSVPLCSFLCFLTYTLLGNELTAIKAFTTMVREWLCQIFFETFDMMTAPYWTHQTVKPADNLTTCLAKAVPRVCRHKLHVPNACSQSVSMCAVKWGTLF